MKRRQLFFTLPLLAATAQAQSSELKESDAEAIALDYKADARKVDRVRNPKYQPGQTCANCGLFVKQDGAPLGGCQLFYGKDVAAIGWCNAWEAKPA